MANKGDWKDLVTLEELVLSNMYTQEALINVLVKRGVVTNEEIIEEIKKLKVRHEK